MFRKGIHKQHLLSICWLRSSKEALLYILLELRRFSWVSGNSVRRSGKFAFYLANSTSPKRHLPASPLLSFPTLTLCLEVPVSSMHQSSQLRFFSLCTANQPRSHTPIFNRKGIGAKTKYSSQKTCMPPHAAMHLVSHSSLQISG